MKILHVDPEMGFGGGERQVAGLLRRLAERGHENVLAAPPEGRLAATVGAADAKVVPLRIRNDLDLLAALRLRGIARREAPDVVHYHTSRAHALSPWVRRHARPAVVTRRMDYRIRRGAWKRMLFVRAVDGVAAISGEVRRRLLEADVPPERIRRIPSSVELPGGLPGPSGRRAARERFGVDGPETVVTVVAHLVHRKGHDVLLGALARLAREETPVRCLVCGDGPERPSLERMAEDLGVSGSVRFLGERSQVADVLAATDVFVMPSRWEGLGVAILEAMAMALPVVATRVGGIPEVVAAGETGLLVPPEDDEALAVAIRELVRDGEMRRLLGEAGRDRVRREFSVDAMTTLYEAFYRDLRKSSP